MLGLTTVAKYKSLEKRVKELEKINSELLADKTRRENRIEKLEKKKRDLIEENSGLKLALQEVNEFNLKLQDTLKSMTEKCEEFESHLKDLESGLQRQVNEYDKAIKTIAELTTKINEQDAQIEELKSHLNPCTVCLGEEAKEEKTPALKKPITPVKRRSNSKIPKRKVVVKAETTSKKKASSRTKKQ